MEFHTEVNNWYGNAHSFIAGDAGNKLFFDNNSGNNYQKYDADTLPKNRKIPFEGVSMVDSSYNFSKPAIWSSEILYRKLSETNDGKYVCYSLVGRKYIENAVSGISLNNTKEMPSPNLSNVYRIKVDDNKYIYPERIQNKSDSRFNTWFGYHLGSDIKTQDIDCNRDADSIKDEKDEKDGKSEKDNKNIGIFGGQLLSLWGPTLPSGFIFAVFERSSGQVLYHSDEKLSLIDNIYSDVENNPWFMQYKNKIPSGDSIGTEGNLVHETIYKGSIYRFYLNSIDNTQCRRSVSNSKDCIDKNDEWMIVTLYNKDIVDGVMFWTIVSSVGAWIAFIVTVVFTFVGGVRKLFFNFTSSVLKSASYKSLFIFATIIFLICLLLYKSGVSGLIFWFVVIYIFSIVFYVGAVCLLRYCEFINSSKFVFKFAIFSILMFASVVFYSSVTVDFFNKVYWGLTNDYLQISELNSEQKRYRAIDEYSSKYNVDTSWVGNNRISNDPSGYFINKGTVQPCVQEFDYPTFNDAASFLSHSGLEELARYVFGAVRSDNCVVATAQVNRPFYSFVVVLLMFILILAFIGWIFYGHGIKRVLGLPIFTITGSRKRDIHDILKAVDQQVLSQQYNLLEIIEPSRELVEFIKNGYTVDLSTAAPLVCGANSKTQQELTRLCAALHGCRVEIVGIKVFESRAISELQPVVLFVDGIDEIGLGASVRQQFLALLGDVVSGKSLNICMLSSRSSAFRMVTPEAYPFAIQPSDIPSADERVAWNLVHQKCWRIYDWHPKKRWYQPKLTSDVLLEIELNTWPEVVPVIEAYKAEIESCGEVTQIPTERIMRDLARRCSNLYRYRWQQCTTIERTVLIGLAKGISPNPRCYVALEYLEQHGYIYFDVGWRLATPSFARFVHTAESPAQVQQWMQAASGSIWHYARLPLFFILVGVFSFFAYASTDTLQQLLAALTAGLAVIPALVITLNTLKGTSVR